MSISRSDLAVWVGAEFAELLTAAGLTVIDGATDDAANSITKALREMGLSAASELTDEDAAEVYDLVDLFVLERIMASLAVKVDFSADGASIKLRQQYEMAQSRYNLQKARCEAAYGLAGGPSVAVRLATLNALTDEETEYS